MTGLRRRNAPEILYWDSAYYGKAQRRARTMADTAICDWIGTAVSGMYKAMQDFRENSTPESLLEMQEGLVAAYALLGELRLRRDRQRSSL